MAFRSSIQSLTTMSRSGYTRALWLFLLAAIAILTLNSLAIAQSVRPIPPDTELLSPENVSASPGDILTASIRITNTFRDHRKIRITVDAPPNWEFSIIPGILELDSGESDIVFITLTVPIDASPGESEIILNALPEGDLLLSSTVRVKVAIARVTRLAIQPIGPDKRETAAGDPITQTFMLSNLGNSTERVRIEMKANQDWDVDLEPSDPLHVMEPGQIDTITVVVHSPKKLANSVNLHVTLNVRPDEPGAEIAAQAAMSTRVVPSQPSQQSIYPSLHGNTGIIVDLNNEGDTSTSLEIGPLRCDMSEDRQLIIGPVNLLLEGDSQGIFIEDQRISASYEDDNRGYIRAGDFSLDLGSPLLEHYLWGRGGDIFMGTENNGYRAFYVRTRGSRPETDAGIQLIYDLGATGTARLTALKNTELRSAGGENSNGSSSTNLGLYTAFEPFKGTTIAGELAGTNSSGSDFDGGWRLSGKCRIEGLSLNYEMLQAADGFRGGYQDIKSRRFDGSWRPVHNLSLWANYYVSRNNLDDNPDEELFRIRDFTYGGAWTIDNFGRLGVTHRTAEHVDFMERTLDQKTNSIEYSYSTNINNIFASTIWRLRTDKDRLTGDIEKNRTLQFQCVARVNDHASLRFNLTSERYALNDSDLTRRLTSIGVGCGLHLSEDMDLSLNVERNIENPSGQRTSIVGSLDRDLSEGRRLRLHYRSLRGCFGQNTEMALEFDFPISMPLHVFPVMGLAEGRIFLSNDPDQGVQDARVLVDGFEAITDDLGNFMFPALLPGDYELDLDYDTLDIGLTPKFSLPLRFEVEAGSRVEIEIPMVRNAAIEGYVRLECITADGEIKPDGPLGGVLIELQSGLGSDFKYADDSGHFAFTDLPPGAYILKIRTDSLPEYSEVVDLSEYSILLAPGEVKSDVDFLVKPIEREIIIVVPSNQS